MDQRRRYRNEHIERELRANVAGHGYSLTAMIPRPPKEPLGWTYTVGMTGHKMPELVVPDMPGHRAAVYLQKLADCLLASKVVLAPGAKVRMHDATVWQVRAQHPRATFYGVHWATRLYGERKPVRAVAVVPPVELATPPGELWPGYKCGCGCEKTDPLAAVGHRVGSVFLG
jgi:hypothetical protein